VPCDGGHRAAGRFGSEGISSSAADRVHGNAARRRLRENPARRPRRRMQIPGLRKAQQMSLRKFPPSLEFLNWRYDGATIAGWIGFVLISLAVFVVLRRAQKIMARRWGAIATRTRTSLDDLLVSLINRTNVLLILLISLWTGTFMLTLNDRTAALIYLVLIVAFIIQVGIWSSHVMDFALDRMIVARADFDPALRTAVGGIGFIGRVIIWSVVALLVLSNLHVNVTTLVAGLGVGGIAIALAVQNVLGDLFASLSILLDRPFVVGEFIVIDSLAGTVEHVGLKTTRIRSLSGEQIVMSNGDLLKSRIHNYKKLAERRIVFGFGVTYDTGYEKLTKIPAMVREIISGVEKIRFDRAHFKEYGDSSLNFEVVYIVLDPDYNIYMDVQQKINLEIYRRFAEQGIEFAFPTRTLYLNSVTPPA
jgi:small-conductance mechanosensitive channel